VEAVSGQADRPPVLRDDITPVIEFARARLNERRAGFGGGTAGELAAAYPQETWMESLIYRYRAITDYADAPYRAAEMTPETTARQEGYIHALAVAITTMADIWAGYPGKPEYDAKTGLYVAKDEQTPQTGGRRPVSEDPATRPVERAARLAVDLAQPPGVFVMQFGTEETVRTVSFAGGLDSEDLREDLRSFRESFPYLIRVDGRGEPIRCEVCGTLVALTYEALTVSAGGKPPARRRWKPGIWEPEAGRRHTMRRCEWRRRSQ
jgi:hypothetical protein